MDTEQELTKELVRNMGTIKAAVNDFEQATEALTHAITGFCAAMRADSVDAAMTNYKTLVETQRQHIHNTERVMEQLIELPRITAIGVDEEELDEEGLDEECEAADRDSAPPDDESDDGSGPDDVDDDEHD